jgi:hypothetical protein
MTLDVAGYVNMAIGLAGIVVTLLASPSMLEAFSRARSEQLPPQLAGAGGVVRLASLIFVLLAFTLLVAIGLVVSLSSVASALGATAPVLCSTLLIAALFSLATTLTLYV